MRGGFQTLAKMGLAQDTSRGRRGFNGLRLADCGLVAATTGGSSGGGTTGLTRTASGIVFHDDFNRADGALGGNWVDDAGTWAISSGQATNSSGGNYDRCRNTGVSLAAGVYEARLKAINGSNYCGLRYLAPSAADDYHVFLNGGNSDKKLSRAAATDTTIASGLTLTMDTNYHVVKAKYVPSQKHVIWFDHNVTPALGSVGTPFNGAAGPTAAGAVGFISFAGAALYDWVLVSTDHVITVTGLSGTQAFRLYDASDVVIGSSGVQSGGSATLDIATLVDGLVAGHIQVFDDEGTWAAETPNGRYPVSSIANDLCGGDEYALT
jgi:hypothetical protein